MAKHRVWKKGSSIVYLLSPCCFSHLWKCHDISTPRLIGNAFSLECISLPDNADNSISPPQRLLVNVMGSTGVKMSRLGVY